MIENPPTARILQISPKETISYDMPWDTYEEIRDVFETWYLFHKRGDKPTVERIIRLFEKFVTPDIRQDIVEKRAPTKPEIKGFKSEVWYDEFVFLEDLT